MRLSSGRLCLPHVFTPIRNKKLKAAFSVFHIFLLVYEKMFFLKENVSRGTR